MKVEEIFERAIEMTANEQRDAFVASACGTDAVLLAKVQGLLKSHDEASQFLQQSLFESAPTVDEVPREGPGSIIGPYKLLQEIGHGGMGMVFMAEQHEPVRRKVALKIIKPGMDSRQVLARFEAERQALSLMDHPNIAKVLDAGTTSSGRPYFVMELVKGQPITQYCDENKLTPRQRLELLLPVCQAIQHAHQKGIIHRDIKPSNILVAEYDQKPVPKVIDFGVAKATSQPLTDRTMFTGFGQVVGTLEYMSPEQAKVNQLDIDTRSDIYSLGVLMYELLTGTTPFDRKRLKQAAWDEMLRIIREEEPPKPSTRLFDSKDSLPSISAQRHTEPAKLTKLVRGELDWIVMKALEKDRSRRYETANGMAMDLLRYLNDEAVSACPPSASYRFSKFVRRNKGNVLAASLIVLALLAGIAGTSWQAFRAENARQEEARQREVAEANEKKARDAAEAERLAKLDMERKRQEAERNLAYAKKGNDILGSVFAGLDPKANYATVAELRNALRDNLTKAVKELEGSSIGDPLEVAAMQNKLGHSLLGLGEAKLAIEIISKAHKIQKERLGIEHPKTLVSMNDIAICYQTLGNMDKALPLLQESLKLSAAKLGIDHPDTLDSMNNLAMGYQAIGEIDKALTLWEETVKLSSNRLGIDHSDTLDTMNNLALGYKDAGMINKALPLWEKTVKLRSDRLGVDHLDTLATMNNLAIGYHDTGNVEKAILLYEEAVKKSRSRLGTDHHVTLTLMTNLADCYRETGRIDKALPILEETLKFRTVKLGLDHPETLTTMNTLGVAYGAAGMLDKKLSLSEESLKLHTKKLGTDHPDTLLSMNNLAVAYRDAGRLDKALPLIEETVKQSVSKLGKDHPKTLTLMNNLAVAYSEVRKMDKALSLQEEVLNLRTAKLGIDHPDTLHSMINLAGCYREIGNMDKAVQLAEEVFKLSRAKLGHDHPVTLQSMNNLATSYHGAGMKDKALPLQEEVLKLRTTKLGADHPNTLVSMNNLAMGYQAAGKMDKALPLLEETLKLRTAKLGIDHPSTLDSVNKLAEGYQAAGHHDKALALYQAMLKQRMAKMGHNHLDTASSMMFVSSTLIKLQRWSEAEDILRQALAIREKQQPDAWNTFNTRSLLGEALLGQKKYAEAEPLLVQGYEGMKEREKSIPANGKKNLVQALDRLIQFYTETSKPEEVKKWQTEKDRLAQPINKK